MSANRQQPNPVADKQKVILRGVIVAYTQGLFKAKAFQAGGVAKFSASFIGVGPKALELTNSVEAALVAAAANTWGDDRKRWPRLRGLSKEPIVKAVAEFPTMWPDAPTGAVFVRAGTEPPPGFADALGNDMTAQEAAAVIFSGWFVNVSLRAFTYDQQTGAGVSLGLNSVQLVRPGKRIAGRMSASQEFGPVPEEELNEADDEA